MKNKLNKGKGKGTGNGGNGRTATVEEVEGQAPRPGYREFPRLVKEGLLRLVRARADASEEMARLKQKREALDAEIGGLLDSVGQKSVACEDWTVTVCQGKNVNINKNRLLELGVGVDLIAQATTVKEYSYVQVTKRKEKE